MYFGNNILLCNHYHYPDIELLHCPTCFLVFFCSWSFHPSPASGSCWPVFYHYNFASSGVSCKQNNVVHNLLCWLLLLDVFLLQLVFASKLLCYCMYDDFFFFHYWVVLCGIIHNFLNLFISWCTFGSFLILGYYEWYSYEHLYISVCVYTTTG